MMSARCPGKQPIAKIPTLAELSVSVVASEVMKLETAHHKVQQEIRKREYTCVCLQTEISKLQLKLEALEAELANAESELPGLQKEELELRTDISYFKEMPGILTMIAAHESNAAAYKKNLIDKYHAANNKLKTGSNVKEYKAFLTECRFIYVYDDRGEMNWDTICAHIDRIKSGEVEEVANFTYIKRGLIAYFDAVVRESELSIVKPDGCDVMETDHTSWLESAKLYYKAIVAGFKLRKKTAEKHRYECRSRWFRYNKCLY